MLVLARQGPYPSLCVFASALRASCHPFVSAGAMSSAVLQLLPLVPPDGAQVTA